MTNDEMTAKDCPKCGGYTNLKLHCQRCGGAGKVTDAVECGVQSCTRAARENGFCSYHTPCRICGLHAGPVGHYASRNCKSHGLKRDGTGSRTHCTCDACF